VLLRAGIKLTITKARSCEGVTLVGEFLSGRKFSGEDVRQRKKGKKTSDRPTIYVRRNGSRFIDTNELINSDEFRETLEKLKGIDLKRIQKVSK
jgi:hypothetical protein